MQTDAFYDATGSVAAFAVLASCWQRIESGSALSSACFVAIVLVLLWEVRLGSFLLYRICKLGHDSRMDKMKRLPSSFFIAWTMQGLWIYIITLPVQALAVSDVSASISVLRQITGSAGLLVWGTGFLLESIADWQKLQFRLKPANKVTIAHWPACPACTSTAHCMLKRKFSMLYK